MRTFRSFILLAFTMVLLTVQLRAGTPPKLIVVVAIDQMRGDHLTRYASLYTAGFTRLTTEGLYFPVADLNYAGTATGPGHATLGTGVYPWKSGIVANKYVERATGAKVYCVADSLAAPVDGLCGSMSPRNLLVPGFTDWLKNASPRSRVISISYKDRAAVLMGGKKPDGAYWFDRVAGGMGTSSYYMGRLPGWVREFNASGWIEAHLPSAWTKLLCEEAYTRFGPDDMQGEPLWQGTRTFPHAIEPHRKVARLFSTPWGNEYLLDFARAAIAAEKLGRGTQPDVLWVSLSTTDDIGSEFGPNSHEMIDNLVRIDRALGGFLAYLDATFGRGGAVVALSGDHGVMQMPEYLVRFEGITARRVNNEELLSAAVKNVDAAIGRELGVETRIVKSGKIDEQLIAHAAGNLHRVQQQVREALLGVDGVADVYFKNELLDPAAPDRPYLALFRHSYNEERSPDYLIRDCEYCLVGSDTTGSSHGTPYLYDRVVPLVFWGTGRPPLRIERTVHTVDLAATLAKMLEVPMPAWIDGVPLQEVVE